MSEDTSGGKVDSELANRLDTLFDDDEVATASPSGEAGDPLDELKSLVMSIEWEITDDLMGRFVSQVESLKKRYKDDRILVMFLQLLGSLGLYVKSNKGNAHPSAFSLLNSVYASFANAALPGKISSSEKKKLLYVELNRYKELKEQIGLSRDTTKEMPIGKESLTGDDDQAASEDARNGDGDDMSFDQPAASPSAGVTREQFEEAIESLKKLIQDEFAKMREVLVKGGNT
ncbi:MAG: hypothetical protein QNJ48_00490 [Desulfobacterales bacterium]|nr:hypothetical protein [Desulfobacterales bacterium]MDJ0873716.1 hypothetical protein [Desulfobacterales bacterium]MDJ0882604.1 hypothetical protein [Desulfobacterales bacterium]